MSRLSVIAISDAFRTFWNDLAADLEVPVEVVPASAAATTPETVAFIVAAGGAEREAIQWLERRPAMPGIPVLVVGTDPGRRTAMQMVAHGADDYFAFPDDLEIFRNAVVAILRRGRPQPETSDHSDAFAGIVGVNPGFRKDIARAARLVPHRNGRALILGETGTGKELLARAIHAGGPRRDAPFVAVNCSALPEHLVESELFGHERGSFTDAHSAKPGLFEVADTGTLFLDEVGDLPLPMQAKLLRVLEDQQIRRVGGTKSRKVDVRILAATNERLPERVREGLFRQDLYFRLSSVVLRLPPLRERGDDSILIAEALLQHLAADHGLPVPPLTADICRQIRNHAWPGNVRELKNAVERALLLSPPGQLNVEELLPPVEPQMRTVDKTPIPFPAPLHEITSAAAHATVRLCGGNRSESARRLGISSRRLRRLLSGAPDIGDEAEEEDFSERTPLSIK